MWGCIEEWGSLQADMVHDFILFIFLDNGFIHVYLRGCKYNLEDTRQRLDTWHSVRTRYPEMFENWNYKDPKIKELISAG